MTPFGWLRRSPFRPAAERLYATMARQARRPEFYRHCGVPDTLDGRYEVFALHGFAVLRRLRGEGPAATALAQDLFDTMFADFETSLRELGAADIGVGKRVKRMARSFYGRVSAYDEALGDTEPAVLEAALKRNLFGTVGAEAAQVSAMASYLRACVDTLSRWSLADLVAGELTFPDPPTRTEETLGRTEHD